MELLPGAYETIINAAIKERLNRIEPENTYVAKEDIDSSSSNDWLANYLANVVSSLLCEKFKDEKREKTISEQVDCINAILRYIEKEWEFNTQEELIEDSMPSSLRRIFTMKRQEIAFPLVHPPYVIEEVDYRERMYKVNAWDHPFVKIRYSLEELGKNLVRGNFSIIYKALVNRLRKFYR